jgi:hypothetical protein
VVLVKDLPAPPLPELPPPGEIEAGIDLAHLPDPTVLDRDKDAAFLRNTYIGNILFGGGFIRTGHEALEVRARLIEFSLQEPYREQGRYWLQQSVEQLLIERRMEYSMLESFEVPEIEYIPVRGLHPEDGRDNVNLPRTTLVPKSLKEPVSAPTLVPYLKSYYTHSGGWFLGQQYGCMGGARVEVLVVLYQEKSPVWWMEATGRFMEGDGMPSRAALDQYLLWAEDQVEAILKRDLPK